ncbi:hypothetical protein DQ04_05351020 [Trypanosoma grayi]|uniref:hypothetical protein n=1 Tax=Trypanosoma grayi TaxID=71804 RepID=UPI0004F47997|nr:hypothetical protein DQ04_05351020 [Trypanosoma grayi]KEG09361.1 hypothetical protein DQ04_05351020 [Trypanosoma grayi]
MSTLDKSLTDAEQYAVWCEQTRALFAHTVPQRCGSADRTSAHTSKSGSSTNGEEFDASLQAGAPGTEDGGDFPYCFYMRMLSCGGRREAIQTSCDDSRGFCSEDGGSFFSSLSEEQEGQKLYVDEDALTARLASKLKTHARTIRSKQQEQIPATLPVESVNWPYRDGSVEVLAAAVNEELHEMLMYVRHRNMLAEQLRRQLVETRRLLLQQGEAPS